MLEHLTVDDFIGTEGKPYAVETGGGEPVEFTLLSAERGGDPRPFSLVFRGPGAPQLDQGTYSVTHPTLGQQLPLFLVPIARDDEGLRYQIIFG